MSASTTTEAPPRTPARSDHVGSLLRPRQLLEEVHRIYERGHTTLHREERDKDRGRLRELEDEAIRQAVVRQVDAGLDVVTDGEFRRVLFTNSFYDAVDGLEPNPHPLIFYGDDGSEVEHPGPALVGGRLRKIDSPAAREAGFLASLDRPAVQGHLSGGVVVLLSVAAGSGHPERRLRKCGRGAGRHRRNSP